MISLMGIATIVLGIIYFLACDNIGKTLVTPNEIVMTKVILGAGICITSVGIALEFF